MTDDDELERTYEQHTELPEGALINAHICVDQFIDREGDLKYTVHYSGQVPLSQIIGLLELAKKSVLGSEEDW